MKLRANEKGEGGVGALGIITLVVLVVILAAAGFFTYRYFHKSTSGVVKDNVPTTITQAPTNQNNSNTNSSSTNQSQTASTSQTPTTSTAIESSTGTSVVKFSQLGVEVTVPNSIDDLIYLPGTTKTAPTAKTAVLSTTALSNLDPACGVDATKTSASIQGIGELSEYSGTFTASTNPDKTAVWSKQFTSFYVAYNTPASDCSKTASTNTKAAAQITALKSALVSMTVTSQ
jgi:hypothetical protein